MTIPTEAFNKLQLFYKSKIVQISIKGEGAIEFQLDNGTVISLEVPEITGVKVWNKDDIYPTLS